MRAEDTNIIFLDYIKNDNRCQDFLREMLQIHNLLKKVIANEI